MHEYPLHIDNHDLYLYDADRMPIPTEVFQQMIESSQDMVEGKDGGIWIVMLLIFGTMAAVTSITVTAGLELLHKLLREK